MWSTGCPKEPARLARLCSVTKRMECWNGESGAKAVEVVESRDLDEDTVIDLDAKGNICAMTMEHAKGRADVPRFTFEEIAA